MAKKVTTTKATTAPSPFQSLPPIIGKNPEILILGTAPSVNSIAAKEYYASPDNCFWDVISARYNGGKSFSNYSDKVDCLIANKVALWDIYASGMRIGSKNSTITNAKFNNIRALLKKYPSIKRIVCNGKDVAAIIWKWFLPVPMFIAPNTSNASRLVVKTTSAKITIWRAFL